MVQLTAEAITNAYRRVFAAIPQEALELDLRITIKTIQALSKGKAIAIEELASIWEMPLEQVQAVIGGATAAGRVETDTRGHLVGGILSLNPTSHRILMGGKTLFAWCAYDAIYTPGVVGKTARIESQDPVTGEAIHFSITPEGVEDVQPSGSVVSVVGADTDTRGGPQSPRCTQMLFFASRETADQWLSGRAGIAILTLQEVFEMAQEFQIEPARRLGLV